MQPFNLSGTKWLTQQFNSISLTFIYVYVIRCLSVDDSFLSNLFLLPNAISEKRWLNFAKFYFPFFIRIIFNNKRLDHLINRK